MNIKAFTQLALSLALSAVFAAGSAAADTEAGSGTGDPPFREAFFMSDFEREQSVAQAVRVGGVVFVSATTAVGDSFEEQMRTIYIRIQSILAQYGLSLSDVAQERIYALDLAELEPSLELRKRFYRFADPPASTWLQVAGLPGEGHLLSIEVIAVQNPEED